jgi:hypothetical protein
MIPALEGKTLMALAPRYAVPRSVEGDLWNSIFPPSRSRARPGQRGGTMIISNALLNLCIAQGYISKEQLAEYNVKYSCPVYGRQSPYCLVMLSKSEEISHV